MQGHVYATLRNPLYLPKATADREFYINSVHLAPSLKTSVCFYREFQEWNHLLLFLPDSRVTSSERRCQKSGEFRVAFSARLPASTRRPGARAVGSPPRVPTAAWLR